MKEQDNSELLAKGPAIKEQAGFNKNTSQAAGRLNLVDGFLSKRRGIGSYGDLVSSGGGVASVGSATNIGVENKEKKLLQRSGNGKKMYCC